MKLKNSLSKYSKSILTKIYSKAIWHQNRNEKSIYLTFDDGPICEITEWVLDELKKNNAKATFFCLGKNIIKLRPIYNRILEEGHQVGNHTMSHLKGFKSSINKYIKEVEDCNKLMNSNLFRPPFGQLRPRQYKRLLKLGYKIILWDNISYDYKEIEKELCLKNCITNIKNGSIILFHDTVKAEKNLKYVLPVLLKQYSDLGFEFKKLEIS